MKRTNTEKSDAMKRAQDMEANMAIEGLHMHPDDRAVSDAIIESNLSEDEAFEKMKEHLRGRGLSIDTDIDALFDVAE